MPAKIYRVSLTEEERQSLEGMTSKGRERARRIQHARILLLADESRADGGWQDAAIAEAVGVSKRTVERVRTACVEKGIEAALNHQKPQTRREPILDGAGEARLIELACSPAPEGHARWSLRLLREKLIEMEVVETIGRETVRTTLKKMNLSPGSDSSGASHA